MMKNIEDLLDNDGLLKSGLGKDELDHLFWASESGNDNVQYFEFHNFNIDPSFSEYNATVIFDGKIYEFRANSAMAYKGAHGLLSDDDKRRIDAHPNKDDLDLALNYRRQGDPKPISINIDTFIGVDHKLNPTISAFNMAKLQVVLVQAKMGSVKYTGRGYPSDSHPGYRRAIVNFGGDEYHFDKNGPKDAYHLVQIN